MKLDQLSGQQLRTLRRQWDDLGGSKAVDRGTLEPFHKYIASALVPFIDSEPGFIDLDGIVQIDCDPVNSLIKNERAYAEVSK